MKCDIISCPKEATEQVKHLKVCTECGWILKFGLPNNNIIPINEEGDLI